MSIPHTVFIIPYRNRPKEKESLDKFLTSLKKDRNWSDDDVKILYITQSDNKYFNRGAMKNIGFLYLRYIYPENYKQITLIFHDVDFHPSTTQLLNYSTKKGVVEHYYGFSHVLGGVFSIKAGDFEITGGFPNYWGWGLEDNVMYDRCKKHNLTVDRSNFFKIYDKNFLYVDDGDKDINQKRISMREYYIYKYEKNETFDDIKNIVFRSNGEQLMIEKFKTGRDYSKEEFTIEDLNSTGGCIRGRSGYYRRIWKMPF